MPPLVDTAWATATSRSAVSTLSFTPCTVTCWGVDQSAALKLNDAPAVTVNAEVSPLDTATLTVSPAPGAAAKLTE